MFSCLFLTAQNIEKWWKNKRSEFSRLMQDMKGQKSGAPRPQKWGKMKVFMWENMQFVKEDIRQRNKEDEVHDPMVGICIEHISDVMYCTHSTQFPGLCTLFFFQGSCLKCPSSCVI